VGEAPPISVNLFRKIAALLLRCSDSAEVARGSRGGGRASRVALAYDVSPHWSVVRAADHFARSLGIVRQKMRDAKMLSSCLVLAV
jgi:hypothetical protein